MFLKDLKFSIYQRIFKSAAVAFLGLGPWIVSAQQADNAIVVGTVYDSSHAVVSGAAVKLTHLGTNAVTEVRTDGRGEYRTPPIKIGEYAAGAEDYESQGGKLTKLAPPPPNPNAKKQ